MNNITNRPDPNAAFPNPKIPKADNNILPPSSLWTTDLNSRQPESAPIPFVAIPGSSNPAHIAENHDIFDFELSAEEMGRIASLDRNEKHDWYWFASGELENRGKESA